MKQSIKAFVTLEQRKAFLSEFRERVVQEFGNDFYLSVFGSFIRDDFCPGRSDIDIGFYACDSRKSFLVKDFIWEYFAKETDIEVQIINLAFTDYCWIYLNVLSTDVVLCDGHLDELKVFQRRLKRQYRAWKPQYDRHCRIQNYKNRTRLDINDKK